MLKNLLSIVLTFFALTISVKAQVIPLPYLQDGHPRLLVANSEKENLKKQIKTEKWAADVLQGIKDRVDPYVEKLKLKPDWLYSRLMMYWKSRATQVYINGGVYSKAEGEAPVPTVRFGSTRGVSSAFKRPSLADIIPFMDDTKGVYFRNTSKSDSPLEWVDQSQVSGSNIESVNEEIMGLAKDGAFLYWLTDDKVYAELAFGVLDTYLLGLYYRNEPIDLNHGHAQTLLGMTTFEVIQERILNESALTYDFLYNYIDSTHRNKKIFYESALKKCIDLSIKNGVPHNNWNLHKSKFILKVAMVLAKDGAYSDRKGREYYINSILNTTSPRHWSLTRFMDYGYDRETGVWNESPGYAQSVGHELTQFFRDYDNAFNQNLLPYVPVMYKAIEVLPQYLFPNGLSTAFGDSYYGELNLAPVAEMIRLNQKYKERDKEIFFTKMYKLFDKGGDGEMIQSDKLPAQLTSFFTEKPLAMDNKVSKGKLRDFVTPTFYAPNVSWFVQRNKYDSKDNGLMISQYGSYGNHMHSNGLAMEIYGKGYVLGSESGIGSSYFEKPYLEYYSQFPAHNTVMVDGISKYPEMLSAHGFDLLSCYPKPAQKTGFYEGVTYSNMYFFEPESRSDQNRLMSIVNTGPSTGYYVDIFRSRKQKGGEKYHDYFYHNLGQQMKVTGVDGRSLDMKSSDEMGFAGGHLFALDYMWDKSSARTDKDYNVSWKMSFPDSNNVYMHLWMKGYAGREVFSIKAPPVKSYRKNYKLPYDFLKDPYLTISARQHGEAWNHPFVSIFEPTFEKDGKSIDTIGSFTAKNASPDFVGIHVINKTGRHDYIFSSVIKEDIEYEGMIVNGTYALITGKGEDFTLFLGNGNKIAAKGFSLESRDLANIVLEYRGSRFFYSSDHSVELTFHNKTIKLQASDYRQIDL